MSAARNLRRLALRESRPRPEIPPLTRGRNDRERIANGLADMKVHGLCNLCGGPPDVVGIFIPTESLQRRMLAPPGKERLVAFALCWDCWALPDAMDRVDAGMVALAETMSKATKDGTAN